MNFRLFFLIGFVSFYSFSQEGYYGETLNSNIYAASQIIISPSIQPPDVAAFQKNTFVPVSNYTGRAEISIPIYEISSGNMSVPISLSYNSSGVKVADMASSVGLNWSLNAGGVISRMVKGMDDFTRPYVTNNPVPFMSPSGWLGYTYSNLTTYGSIGRYNDSEPDLFVVNAPGLSTNYVHKKHYNATNGITTSYPSTIGSKPDALELDHQGNTINESIGYITKYHYNDNTRSYNNITKYGLSNVEITSLNGVIYDFATPDLSRHHSPYGGGTITYKMDTYHLDQMFDPSTNQTITFQYEQYHNYFADEKDSKITSYGGGTYLGFTGNTAKTVYPYMHRLTKISFDKGEVEFIYGLNRSDNFGEKALTEIRVKDNSGNVIKHVKLSYSYFQSSIASGTPQSKRLRLDKIYDVNPSNVNTELPGHVFTYNTTYTMPPRTSYAHDYLGYNNGSYNSSITNPEPKYYFKNNEVLPFFDSAAIYLTGNYSLEANENYCKTYSLTKIKFPTGGTNEYEYELNEFNYSGTRLGGGLRIKSQKITDDKGNEQILDYEYGTGYIERMPDYAVFKLKNTNWNWASNPTSLSQLVSYFGIDTFMTPQSQVELTHGSFVGYSSVTVRDRVANGKSVYQYSNPSTYPNIASSKTSSGSSYGNSWLLIGPPSLSANRDFRRGKPTWETVYDHNNNIRLQKRYVYTYKEFSTLSLSHLNKASTLFSESSSCWPGNGDQYATSSCGAFTENLNLPIARDLLTTVWTTDYTNGASQDPFKVSYSYTYDKQFPLILNETKSVEVCEPTVQGGEHLCIPVEGLHETGYSKTITYPITGGNTMQSNVISSMPLASDLVNLNRLSTPLTINSPSGTEEKHYYKNFGYNIIALEKIDFVSRDNNIANSEKITKRDSKGHVIEYQKRNGTYVSRIYGHNKTYLIAEIENLTYSSIEALSGFGGGFNITNNLSTSQENTLRSLSNAMVTTYQYDLLVGITAVTDPRGYKTTYEYDEFNRLKQVKDADGKILSENEYHYKGQ
ncbi:YD repeat-containing protein [Jejuia pallidilutea]|uniref:YD repeat-containing protein n=1 Tax=Jejuia pallidilutea TaxID=504487 RepID=A0A362X510_9FLAO|nr:RHS repeat domain-containing protein [Jejuia pallidilutea]PQV47450.1 YD repeat-containing protein [Jejuia pallidilutea]